MSADIFISYSNKDQHLAETFCEYLESPERGFSCWYSARDIGGGANYASAIPRAIRNARVMLFIFSENSNASDEVLRELAIASQYNLIVIPLRIDDIAPNDALAFHFAIRQWIDYFKGREHKALEQLAERIATVMSGKTMPPSNQTPVSIPTPVPEPEPVPDPPKKRPPKRETRPQEPLPASSLNEAESCLTRGDAYFKIAKYDLALDAYKQAVQLAPALPRASNSRGTAYQALGQFDLAMIDFDEAIRLAPDLASAYNNRGSLWRIRNQPERALSDFKEVIRLAPDQPQTYTNRGLVYLGRGELDLAIADFDEALRLKPDFTPALAGRAKAQERKGFNSFTGNMRSHATGLIDRLPVRPELRQPVAFIGGGVIFLLFLMFINAVVHPLRHYTDYGSAYSSSSSDSSSSSSSSSYNVFAADPDAPPDTGYPPDTAISDNFTRCHSPTLSITDCFAIIDDKSQDNAAKANAYNDIAIARYEINTDAGYRDAVTYYGYSLWYMKNDFVYVNRGYAYYLLKDYPHAIADFTSALAINSNYGEAYHDRALAYAASGQSDSASADSASASSLSYSAN